MTLAWQFIVENILVTLIGGGIGLLLALGALEIIETLSFLTHIELGLQLNVFLFRNIPLSGVWAAFRRAPRLQDVENSGCLTL